MFAVILGFAVLHERVGLLGVILIAIIVLLSPLAAYDEHLKLKAFFQKYILLAIIASTSDVEIYYTEILFEFCYTQKIWTRDEQEVLENI